MPQQHQQSAEPCNSLSKSEHECKEELLASLYQAALTHAGPYGHGRTVTHPSWEAFTFVAVSAVILVAYVAVLSYLATRALRQMPPTLERADGAHNVESRVVFDPKKETSSIKPLPPELAEPPADVFEV